MVTAVLDGETDPRPCYSQEGSAEDARHRGVHGVRKRCEAQHAPRRPLAAAAVLAVLGPIKELLAHASTDIVVQLGVVWVGGARHRVHGKIFQNRKALEGGACHLWSQMVALKEPSAVALDRKVDKPVAPWMTLQKLRQVVGNTAVHSPLGVAPFRVLPRVLANVCRAVIWVSILEGVRMNVIRCALMLANRRWVRSQHSSNFLVCTRSAHPHSRPMTHNFSAQAVPERGRPSCTSE
mmetsp:Transcript_38089/g.73033  ORF Transcript_38089/g.73033 Transcript_38089/m.73033 type:complete len:237 (-) Transcript_38089:173-883(-)